MSGNKSRSKGKRGELEARKILAALGFLVEWTPLEDKPDLIILAKKDKNGSYIKLEKPVHWEVKYQAGVPLCIYQWLEEKHAEALLVRRISKGSRSFPWLKIEVLK